MTYEEVLQKFDKTIRGVAFKFNLKMDYEDRVQEGYLILHQHLDYINKIDNEHDQAAYLKTCMINHFKNINLQEHKQFLYNTISIDKTNNENGDNFNLLEEIQISDCQYLDIKDDYIEKRREYQKEYHKKWNKENQAKIKEYYEKNKERKMQRDKERKEERKKLFYNMTKEEQQKILERFGSLTNFANNSSPETIEKKKAYLREYGKNKRQKDKSKEKEKSIAKKLELYERRKKSFYELPEHKQQKVLEKYGSIENFCGGNLCLE